MQTLEGDGMDVMRPFPAGTLSYIDPFLLFDRLGPVTFAPGGAKGVPAHPHRGFEVVTYLLSGRIAHRDSQGGSGTLGPGDVQWMRAGSGLVHSEMPDSEFLSTGGTLHALQLWVNLPQRDKMLPPEYRNVRAASIPRVANAAARAQVVVGEAYGVRSPVATRVPIVYDHFKIARGQPVALPVWADATALAYVLEGTGTAGSDRRPFIANQLIVFTTDGDRVDITAGDNDVDIVVLAGRPLNEPVARYGPFVMNTPHEISQAIDDFRSGKMGTLA